MIRLKACTCMQNSEFMQQDSRKGVKRTAKCLCVRYVIGLLLMCFLVFDKKTGLKEGEVRRKSF